MNFELLPAEILVKIFDYLSFETLGLIEETCRRWSLIIIQTFYKKYLILQHYSIRKNYVEFCRNPESFSPQRIKELYKLVTEELPENWRHGKYSSNLNHQISEYHAGQEGRVSSIALFENKIYFGRDCSNVEVRDLSNLSLIRILNSDLEPVPQEFIRPCRLCIHGRTLAVLGPNRSKVRLFNAVTDEMVGEIETALGPVYSFAISSQVLALLSGWSIWYWKIDAMAPERVRGKYLGSIPDFERDELLQNWLETHEVVINSSWMVTRATRTPMQDGGLKITHFLRVRKVHACGYIGPEIRPDSSRLPDNINEITSMALSDGDLLAVGWSVQEEGVLTIIDLNTGDRVHDIQQPHFLSSIQVPLSWEGSRLFLKIIPVSGSSSEEFGVSLGFLDIRRKELVVIPELVFEKSEDIIGLNSTQVLRVSTRMERLESNRNNHHLDLGLDLETYALLESEEEDFDPVYSVNVSTYDFWKPRTSTLSQGGPNLQ